MITKAWPDQWSDHSHYLLFVIQQQQGWVWPCRPSPWGPEALSEGSGTCCFPPGRAPPSASGWHSPVSAGPGQPGSAGSRQSAVAWRTETWTGQAQARPRRAPLFLLEIMGGWSGGVTLRRLTQYEGRMWLMVSVEHDWTGLNSSPDTTLMTALSSQSY